MQFNQQVSQEPSINHWEIKNVLKTMKNGTSADLEGQGKQLHLKIPVEP